MPSISMLAVSADMPAAKVGAVTPVLSLKRACEPKRTVRWLISVITEVSLER